MEIFLNKFIAIFQSVELIERIAENIMQKQKRKNPFSRKLVLKSPQMNVQKVYKIVLCLELCCKISPS